MSFSSHHKEVNRKSPYPVFDSRLILPFAVYGDKGFLFIQEASRLRAIREQQQEKRGENETYAPKDDEQ